MLGSHARAPARPRCRGSDDRHAPVARKGEPADRGADARGTPPRQIAIGMLNDVQCGNLIKIIWHDGIGMSLYAKRLEHGRSYGPRQPTAQWQSQRRSWPTCSTASTGATRDILGDRRLPAELRQVDSAAWRGRTLASGFDSIGGVNSPAPLPTELAEAHALILQQRQELAATEARASGAAAMIAHLKLVIAKLRRDQYGQSAERGRKLLDQLELQLEELEADATERSVIAEHDTSVQAFVRRRPVRAPLPAHLPRERVVIPAP